MAIALTALVGIPHGLSAHGHGHVKGTVKTVTASSIDVSKEDGNSRQVVLTEKTRYLRGDAKATAADIKPGQRVVIHLAADGTALEVRVEPGQD